MTKLNQKMDLKILLDSIKNLISIEDTGEITKTWNKTPLPDHIVIHLLQEGSRDILKLYDIESVHSRFINSEMGLILHLQYDFTNIMEEE